jgi:hypothetical protein
MHRKGVMVVVLAATLLGACASDNNASGTRPSSSAAAAPAPDTTSVPAAGTTAVSAVPATTVAPVVPRRAVSGAVPTIIGPVTGGTGHAFLSSANPLDLASVGYVEDEYLIDGTATSYVADGDLPGNGRWSVHPGTSASYRTRIVVRRPADPARFNGTLLVEWLNVSAGADSGPDFLYGGREITRGDAWVGVSAQKVGVDGAGTGLVSVPGQKVSGLVSTDPARYSTLHHPGDAYSYDIFSQAAWAVLAPPSTIDPLHGLVPQHVIAVGESQSAFRLTTYIDAVQPLTTLFDGFFVHSRGGSASTLSDSGATSFTNGATLIRDDLSVPTFIVATETDLGPLIGYTPARQPDSPSVHTWELAGTAHADVFVVGAFASVLGCTTDINRGPQHFLIDAALRALTRWVADGTAPPSAPRLVVVPGTPPTIARDGRGNALGGIRTPLVDVPVAGLSGDAAPGSSTICALFGTTVPFSDATLRSLYPDKASYVAAFTASADQAIAAGYVVPEDRDELLAVAAAATIPNR